MHPARPGESLPASHAGLTLGTTVAIATLAFGAVWTVVLSLLLVNGWVNSVNLLKISAASSSLSQPLNEARGGNLFEARRNVQAVGKIAVRVRTATQVPPPNTATPTRLPSQTPTAKPEVVNKVQAQPTAVPSTATPALVAQALAVRPPLPPLIWDKRLGPGGFALLTGVGITPAVVESGQRYWRLVKMQFQDVAVESGDNHNIYVRINDESGQRLNDQAAIVSWDQGGGPEVHRLGLDAQKPVGDLCNCNYDWPMYGAGYRVKVGGALPSDEAYGMIMPERRHVNYILTFQRVVMP